MARTKQCEGAVCNGREAPAMDPAVYAVRVADVEGTATRRAARREVAVVDDDVAGATDGQGATIARV